MADEFNDVEPNDPLAQLPLFPPINLDSNAMPWARRIQKELLDIIRLTRRQLGLIMNENRRTSATLSRQASAILQLDETQAAQAGIIAGLAETSERTTGAVNRLNALAETRYASSNDAITNFSGFYGGAGPSVVITSPTGRLQVQFGGSMNGGNGYIVFSIIRNDTGTVVTDRSVLQDDASRRVALSGGASFSPSAFSTILVNVPRDVPLTVKCEVFATSEFVAFVGRSIFAQVAP